MRRCCHSGITILCALHDGHEEVVVDARPLPLFISGWLSALPRLWWSRSRLTGGKAGFSDLLTACRPAANRPPPRGHGPAAPTPALTRPRGARAHFSRTTQTGPLVGSPGICLCGPGRGTGSRKGGLAETSTSPRMICVGKGREEWRALGESGGETRKMALNA